MPVALRPEPKPLMIVLNAFNLLLCLLWFGFVVLARRIRRRL
ncbi:MAG TPA: hypothetical protein VHE55_09205 [Fimbriimonadaceae bacterium]|nr:hypothetical protein [Fimbriimonadaceae bacterium]